MDSDGLRIGRAVVVPERELTERFSRSSGPGGQGVNTADSRVELSYDVARSPSLPDGDARPDAGPGSRAGSSTGSSPWPRRSTAPSSPTVGPPASGWPRSSPRRPPHPRGSAAPPSPAGPPSSAVSTRRSGGRRPSRAAPAAGTDALPPRSTVGIVRDVSVVKRADQRQFRHGLSRLSGRPPRGGEGWRSRAPRATRRAGGPSGWSGSGSGRAPRAPWRRPAARSPGCRRGR